MTEKAKRSGGIITYNLREGFRSEYLAHYVFSAFGSAVPVSIADDYGIDFICNLAEIEGNLRNVKSSYGVQVKSDEDEDTFQYKGKQAVEWLFRIEYPILFAAVLKRDSKVNIYSTWNVNRFLLSLNPDDKDSFPEKLIFIPDRNDELAGPDTSKGTIPIGKPILSIDIVDIADIDKVNNYFRILREWIEFDTVNHLNRRIGLPTVFGYTRWETNKSLSEFHVWNKMYFFSPYYYIKTKDLIFKSAVANGMYLKANIELPGFKDEFELLRDYVNKYHRDQLEKERWCF